MEVKAKRKKLPSKFGENLERIAKLRGLTHRELSAAAGVSVSVIGDWLGRDGCVPHDLAAVGRLSKALHVPFDELLLSESIEYHAPTIADFFDEVADDRLTGYWRIEARRIVPRGRKP